MSVVARAVLSLPLLAFLLSPTGCSHGAPHDHHADAPAAEDEAPEPATVTLFGRELLLFLEHPRLVRGEPARFLAHLTVLADGEPVRAGQVTLDIGGTRLHADAPRRAGLFTPEGSLPQAGRFPATLAVQAGAVVETLDLGDVVVHATPDEARAEAEAEPPAPADGVPFLMEQQWQVPVLFARTGPARLVQRLLVPAQVRAAEGAVAVVTAPVGGRLAAPAGGSLVRSGERVEAGRVLGLLEPPLTAPELAQLRVLELELARERLAVERDLGEATEDERYAAAERTRVAALREAGLASQQQLDAADNALLLARVALDAARATRQALEAWGAQHGKPAGAPLQVPLVAPIAGLVVAAGSVPGQSVEAGAELFRVVDAARLEIEGRVGEFDLQQLAAPPTAVATFAALPGLRIELDGRPGSRLLLQSPELDAASRSVALRFELPAADPRLRPGLLAGLELATGEVQAEVAIPAEAILVDQGQPTAWVVLEGELFQERALRLGARDGGLVQVLAGLQPGEHVVTRGVATVRLASLSPASFGAGHQH